MNNKQRRMEDAKLARDYMTGGMAPFQTAKKLGFHSVKKNLYAEIQKLKEERDTEAKGHYDELRRNEQLEERVRELEAELQGAGMIGVKVDVDADTKAENEKLKAQNKALTDENIALANALREQNESILRLKEKIADLVMAG